MCRVRILDIRDRSFMKKMLIALIVFGSISAFSYDGGFLKRNCVGADVNKDQLLTVEKELSNIGIKYKIKSNAEIDPEYRVIAIGRNVMIKISSRDGVYFKINRKLQKVLSSKLFREEGVDFSLTTIGECYEF